PGHDDPLLAEAAHITNSGTQVAAFATGEVAGLIKVSAPARRALPTDSISVATAASPSKRIGLAAGPNPLSMEFSLNPHNDACSRRLSLRSLPTLN
ncbi:hypothetical protein, partial [Bradyrhizobium centrolobii]|uniref:hypothetical protein n=1 Tax=Bradyrhizobium centrolobii TaxID=1505087 RepID=UPI001AECF680